MPEQTYVYGLLCPVENKIRYVGKSDKPVERLRAHLSEMRCWRIRRFGYRDQRGRANNIKLNWLNELEKRGLTPELVILETLPWESIEIPLHKANWRKAEMRWVELLYSKGHPLVNREAYLTASSEVLMREAIERGRNIALSLSLTTSCGNVAPPVIDGVWGCLLRRPPEKDMGHRRARLELSKAT